MSKPEYTPAMATRDYIRDLIADIRLDRRLGKQWDYTRQCEDRVRALWPKRFASVAAVDTYGLPK